MNIAIIIAAAGKSERYAPGTAKNKLEQDLGGRPVFMRSFENLAKRPEVKTILVATNPDHFDEFAMRHGDSLAVRGAKAVRGGKVDRWETVKNALAHIPTDATHIAIHDAARPCLGDELIDRLFEAAKLFDAVIPGVLVNATLKRAGEETESAVEDDAIAASILGDAGDSKSKARLVQETLDRRNVYAIQTPQIFKPDLLKRAYAQSNLDSTDDAMLVERLGEPVRLIEGAPFNIKSEISSSRARS
jgi:2-C-methyl-D-erythritol 4-phosphate cytidylyltransferase